MPMLLTLVVAGLVAACSSSLGGGGDGGGPVLVNRTGGALLFVAMDLSASGLVDPNPALNVEEHRDKLVAAGEERAIEIPDYAGDGVLLFIYEIPAADHAGPVPLTRTVQVTREELLRMNGRIVIERQ
ncbi:MAG TPA: hypothetical protein VLK84_16660 [Longimicrobium sp.]|nr:hypothetical protein [Longimicrobium sp.]